MAYLHFQSTKGGVVSQFVDDDNLPAHRRIQKRCVTTIIGRCNNEWCRDWSYKKKLGWILKWCLWNEKRIMRRVFLFLTKGSNVPVSDNAADAGPWVASKAKFWEPLVTFTKKLQPAVWLIQLQWGERSCTMYMTSLSEESNQTRRRMNIRFIFRSWVPFVPLCSEGQSIICVTGLSTSPVTSFIIF